MFKCTRCHTRCSQRSLKTSEIKANAQWAEDFVIFVGYKCVEAEKKIWWRTLMIHVCEWVQWNQEPTEASEWETRQNQQNARGAAPRGLVHTWRSRACRARGSNNDADEFVDFRSRSESISRLIGLKPLESDVSQDAVTSAVLVVLLFLSSGLFHGSYDLIRAARVLQQFVVRL